MSEKTPETLFFLNNIEKGLKLFVSDLTAYEFGFHHIVEEVDDFTEWADQVRRDAGIDPPKKSPKSTVWTLS